MKKVTIYAVYQEATIQRAVFTQQQGFIVIGQLTREGATDITYDFKEMDKLPKGGIVQ